MVIRAQFLEYRKVALYSAMQPCIITELGIRETKLTNGLVLLREFTVQIYA